MDALKDSCKCNSGTKSLGLEASSDLPMIVNMEDEVTTELSWAEKMKLESSEGEGSH